MRERYLRHGMSEADMAYAKAFETHFRKLGWSDERIDGVFAWAMAQPQGRSIDELADDFYQHCTASGIPLEEAGIVETWHGNVVESGVEQYAAEPAAMTDADRARRAEIEAEMAKPHRESKYWSDPAMRDEYVDLLERAGEESGEYVPGPAAAGDSARRAEIETGMKRDFGGYQENEPLQREYAAILQRQSGEAPAASTGEQA